MNSSTLTKIEIMLRQLEASSDPQMRQYARLMPQRQEERYPKLKKEKP